MMRSLLQHSGLQRIESTGMARWLVHLTISCQL